MQNLRGEIAPVLKVIYQRSLDEGAVPDDWRVVNVTPIYKKVVKSDPGNYRLV